MGKRLFILTFGFFIHPLFGQDQKGDAPLVLTPQVKTYNYDAIPKDPLASAFFSATFPGSGQIYNKEFKRGILTAAGFYTGLLVFQYELLRWEEINTDTFKIREYDEGGSPTDLYHTVTSPKPENQQVGLPNDEFAFLWVGFSAMVGFYIWGIVDSYNGAKRYNKKLIAHSPNRVKWDFAYHPARERFQLAAKLKF